MVSSCRAVRRHASSRVRERGYRLAFPLGRVQLTKPVTVGVRIAIPLTIDGRAHIHDYAHGDAYRQRELNPIHIAYADGHPQPDSLRISDSHA